MLENMQLSLVAMAGVLSYLRLCVTCRDAKGLDMTRNEQVYLGNLGLVTIVPKIGFTRRIHFLLHQDRVDIAIRTVSELYHFVMLYPVSKELTEGMSLQFGVLYFPAARYPREPFTQRMREAGIGSGQRFGSEWYANCIEFFCDHSCKTPKTEEEFQSHARYGFPCCGDAENLLCTFTGLEAPKLVFGARWDKIFVLAAERLRERRRCRAIRHQTC